ncbi:MAG: hypothetical protein JST00_14410 [Deltaproteobacteria bacterium]|nr:hypothetical protein [Deltaproteobacteria bacterium]
MDKNAPPPSSPYRNEINALSERRDALASEIEKLREQTKQLDELKAREAKLEKELEGVDVRLREGAPKRALPLLDQVRVASPCKAEWNDMVGDERVRFCLQCEKNVYNLSEMSRDAAEALLRERMGGELCVRFYQRADGTILTQDCPEGVKRKRRKKLAIAIAGAGAMAAAAVTMFTKTQCRTMGAVAYQGEPMMGDVASPPSPPVPTVMGSFAPPPPPAPVQSEEARPQGKPEGHPRPEAPTLKMGRRSR